MHFGARILSAFGLIVLVAAGTAAATVGAFAKTDSAGHVYVTDNTGVTNTVAGFDRHSDGSLTPIDGSPFVAGGRGTGTIIGSQGALWQGGYRRSLSPLSGGESLEASAPQAGAGGSDCLQLLHVRGRNYRIG
jgi:hypothetical protein